MRPLLIYAAAAIISTWPLALHPLTLLGAPVGPGDPYLNLWILGWGLQAWASDPLSVLSGRVFDANIFHPAAGTLAYSDHMLLQSAVLTPLYALTGSVVLCYNALFIGSLVASALAMHLFVSRVVGTSGGAYVAGLVWGFGSYRFAHLIHLQLQALYFLPLTFLFLHRVIAGRRIRDALVLGMLTALQAIASVYYGLIGGLGLMVGAMVLAAGTGRGIKKVAGRLVLAAAVAGVLVAPVGVTYWRVQQSEGFGRSLLEAAHNAAFADSYFQVPPGNVVYGMSGLLRWHPAAAGAASHIGPERELFPGFVLLALAVAGIVLGRRGDARPLVLAMATLVVVAFVFSLGPDGSGGLYAFVHRHVFGFGAIRASARFGVLVIFGLATLAALGWRELSTRSHRAATPWRALTTVALMLVAIENLHLPTVLAAAPPARTSIGQWLRFAPGSGAVAVLPIRLDAENTPAMVQSLEHRRPIVNGYSGQRPSFFGSLVDTLSTFPAPEALATLHDSGVQYVVVPAAVPRPEGEPAWPLVPRAFFADGAIYELVWTPEAEARFGGANAVPAPPVGPLPFRIGETARYEVRLDGAGVDLPAGTVTLMVEPPAYRLVVTAESAPWVSRFFEARYRLVTQTDGTLLPLDHEREMHEGWRHATRHYEYDRGANVVRTQGVVLPLAADARDAVASIFYVRTLTLAPGARVQFPVNEAGRSVTVDLTVGARETIAVNGQQVPAIRLDPRVEMRVRRRAGTTATIWLSDDTRRVPVRAEVNAGFGRLRLELVSYAP